MKKLALFLAIVTILVTCCACLGSFADGELVNLYDSTKTVKQKISHTGILKDKTYSSTYDKYAVSGFIPVKGGDTVYFANADANPFICLQLHPFGLGDPVNQETRRAVVQRQQPGDRGAVRKERQTALPGDRLEERMAFLDGFPVGQIS